MGCCCDATQSGIQCVSKYYVLLTAILSIIAGGLLIGYSTWVDTNYETANALIRDIAFWAPLSFGCMLVIVGAFGVIGSCCYTPGHVCCSKTFLTVYMMLTLILWVAVLIMGSFMLVFAGASETVAKTNSYELEGNEDKLNTWELALFNKCCYEASWSNIEVSTCKNADGVGSSLNEYPGCANQANNNLPCACYNSQELYDELYSAITTDQCDYLGQLKMPDGSALIGPPVSNSSIQDGCGGGEPKQFQKDFAVFIDVFVYGALVAVLFLTCAMILGGCCSCGLLCYDLSDSKYKSMNKDDGTQRLTEVEGEPLTLA